MQFKKLRNDIILINAKDQYELASTFIRLQEFYESPFSEIKGHTFSMEEYMDIYANSWPIFFLVSRPIHGEYSTFHKTAHRAIE